MAQPALVGQSLVVIDNSRSQSDTPHTHSAWLLWTSDQPVAETPARQSITIIPKRQISMSPAWFQPAIVASKRTQTRSYAEWSLGSSFTPQQNVNICCYLYIYILCIKILQCKCHNSMDSPLPNIGRTWYISAYVFLVLTQCSTTCRPWWPQKDIQSFLFAPILWLFLLTSPAAYVLWQWNLECPST